MRPKVSRGLKSTESTKNLALGLHKRSVLHTDSQSQLYTEDLCSFADLNLNLNLQKLGSRRDTMHNSSTSRTELGAKNYTSRTNQNQNMTDREKRVLEPLKSSQNENKKSYADIQRERNMTRKSYVTRNGSKSKLDGEEEQENRELKAKVKTMAKIEEVSMIELEILQILEQENIQCKETIAQLRKESEQRQLSMEFLKKSNDDLIMKTYEMEKQIRWYEDEDRKKEEEMYESAGQLELALKEIECLKLELEKAKRKEKDGNQVLTREERSELEMLRDDNDALICQQEGLKSDLRSLRQQSVAYRREIAKLKRELIDKEENWIEMGQRSSIRIAEGIRNELKQFGEERTKQYEEMLKHYKEEIDFLRERNHGLEAKLQRVKERQIKELICLKRSVDSSRVGHDRADSLSKRERKRVHVKSRSMAMLTPIRRQAEEQ